MMNNKVVAINIKGVMPTSNGCAVFLQSDRKTFVIYMDRIIGESIQRVINGEQTERPMTHELMINLLKGLGATIERVVVNDIKDGTFFARLIVSMHNELGHKIVEIDARPSDSIMLALIAKKPLYVVPKVLEVVEDMTEILAKLIHENE